jgi:hypothetical protein
MRNLILVPLVVFTLGAEDAPQVCSQGPNTTVAATTTTPGPEVDLTRSWVENTKGTTGLAQFRLGITRWLDVRATNDAFMTQMAFRVRSTSGPGVVVVAATVVLGPWEHTWGASSAPRVNTTRGTRIRFLIPQDTAILYQITYPCSGSYSG